MIADMDIHRHLILPILRYDVAILLLDKLCVVVTIDISKWPPVIILGLIEQQLCKAEGLPIYVRWLYAEGYRVSMNV